MFKNKTPHHYFLLIIVILFIVIFIYKLIVINSPYKSDLTNTAPATLDDLRLYLYESKHLVQEGSTSSTVPLYNAQIRSDVFPKYLALRKLQLKEDWAEMEKTGNIPKDRKLGIDLNTSLLQNVMIANHDLSSINFSHTNLFEAQFTNNILVRSLFDYADLRHADLSQSKFQGASLLGADMTSADISGIVWDDNTVLFMANIKDIKNAPVGFQDYALSHGALSLPRDEWLLHLKDFKSSLIK